MIGRNADYLNGFHLGTIRITQLLKHTIEEIKRHKLYVSVKTHTGEKNMTTSNIHIRKLDLNANMFGSQ